VLGVTEFETEVPAQLAKPAPPLVTNMWETYQGVSAKNLLEAYHDAVEYKDQVLQLFNLGHLSLEHRVLCENLFWATCEKVLMAVRNREHVPEELEGLEKALSDTYFCNFSMFQSVPDAWAVDQLFPICPIHRLNEEPTRRATLADITCDSDGKIERFIDLRDIDETLPLHAFRPDRPYYIGFCLMGAYQDVLGDLHNLFGEAHEVLVRVDEDGRSEISDVLPGETCERVLEYMNYDRTHLLASINEQLVRAAGAGLKKREIQAIYREFEAVFPRYTYLER